MKIATISLGGRDALAVATSDQSAVVLLADIYEAAGSGAAPASMRELLDRGDAELDRIRRALGDSANISRIGLDEVIWRPPVPEPSKILGVAMNNTRLNDTAHVAPAGPMFFVKPQNTLVPHQGIVEIGDDYGFTFPELELAVVIGRRVRSIPENEALDYVAGYTIVNDVTSQGLKAGDSIATDLAPGLRNSPGYEDYFSWRRGNGEGDNVVYLTYHARSKGADTFAPMGPFITTRDEVPDPDALEIRGFADGELFTLDSTASYSYPVARIVSWASRYFTLNPGDIIMCGTAAKGVGRFPRAHHDVDLSVSQPVIDIEIEGLGRLRNHVTHTTGPAA